MARGYEPEEFIGPREASEERERKTQQPSRNDESREQVREEPAQAAESKRTVAERQGLQVVRGKIPLPDVRIEYDTADGERARVDIELATSHYRGRHLAEKVRAGFSIYAHASDVSNLRRVLDQRELTAEILSL